MGKRMHCLGWIGRGFGIWDKTCHLNLGTSHSVSGLYKRFGSSMFNCFQLQVLVILEGELGWLVRPHLFLLEE